MWFEKPNMNPMLHETDINKFIIRKNFYLWGFNAESLRLANHEGAFLIIMTLISSPFCSTPLFVSPIM